MRVGLVEERGIITSAYLCLRFKKAVNPVFAHALLHYYDLAKVFYWSGVGLRQSMRYDDIKTLPFVIPPYEDQERIAKSIGDQQTMLNQIIDKLSLQIETLRQIKPSLYTDVVTGRVTPS